MKKIKFGSVCSGIEAASVAWNPLGWEAAWLSEIEPFPSAVLAHHYPTVPNLGDMTTLPERILSGEVEAPDVFCGGTPCQAFSVAGLRNSLDDARGNLSLTFVGIANAIDHVRSVRRDDPAIIFWENVPGVLSTKDNAFGCFLAGLAGEDNPLEPPRGKWTNSGYVLGPKRAVAWRLLDAQYFGVAQRRKRVFVVASARDNFDPAAVLFEFDGVRRDTAPSREAGKTVAPCVTNGPPFSRTGNERVEAEAMVVAARMVTFGEYSIDGTASAMKARDYKDATDLVAQTFSIPAIGHIVEDDVAGTMTRHTGSGAGETQNAAFVAQPIDFRNLRFHEGDVAGTMQAKSSGGYSLNYETGVMQPIALQDITPREKAQNGRGWNDDGTAYTVDTHATQGVAQPISIQGNLIGREVGGPQGVGASDSGVMYTLTKTDVHGVAQPMVLMDQGGSVMNVEHDMVGTLRRETHGHEPVVMQPIGIFQDSEFGVAQYDSAGTLRAGRIPEHQMAIQPPSMAVRRLTPVECERLQGFPDGYTNIPWRKKDESPDGPRYKALGNSWAVPNVRWIGQRIQKEIEKNDL